MSELPSRDGYVRSMRNLKAFYPSDHDAIKAYIDQLEAYVERSTHPQPVTPAGGEVACWIHSSDLEFLKGYPHEAQAVTGASHGPLSVHLYTNPPVADAALPRGHRVDDGKQLAMIRDTERLDWLEQVAFTTYRTRDPETGRLYSHVTFVNEDKAPRRGITRDSFRESIDAAMQDAALNQRGGA